MSTWSANPINCTHNLYVNGADVSATDIVIPNTVTEIKAYAFYNCTTITSVTIGSGVTSIGASAFSGCTSLTRVNYDGDTASWCDITFGNEYANPVYYAHNLYTKVNGVYVLAENIVIPNTVTEIKAYAFNNCTTITSVTVPDSVTSIGYNAFVNCPIETATIPAMACEFISNSALTTVTITSGTSIGLYAFYGCTSLTSVTIGNSVTSIGNNVFSGCTSLTRVNYDGDIAGWCNINFSSYHSNPLYYVNDVYINVNGTYKLLTEIVIPDTVTEIKAYAFYNCKSLTSIIIPDSVTSIGASAFSECSSLTSVTIGSGVMSIGNYAFLSCNLLTEVKYGGDIAGWCSITFGDTANPLNNACELYMKVNAQYEKVTNIVIPDTVTKIKAYSFRGCTSLTSVTIGNSVTSIGSYAFSGCTSLTSVTFSDTTTWYRTTSLTYAGGTQTDVSDAATNATYFKSTYASYYWYKE